jgi:hypothetical protein
MKVNEDIKRKQSFFDYEMESRLSVHGHDEEGKKLNEYSVL